MPVPHWMDRPIHHVVIRSAIAVILVISAANLYLAVMPWLPVELRIDRPSGATLQDVRLPLSRPNCAQFLTQSDAQAYFEGHSAYWLDGDHDGVACERNPSLRQR